MYLKSSIYFFIALLILFGGWFLLDLPPEEELREIITTAFATYGPVIIIAGAFIEALLLIGFYFPGSLIIFLSVALAANIQEAILAVIYVTIGLYSGYLIDYLLGRYGWYKLLVKVGMKEKIADTKEKIQDRGLKYIFLTFWSPTFAALTSTAAGILHLPGRRFALAAFGIVVVWNIFWGTLVYTLGGAALTIVGFKFIIITAALWVIYEILKNFLGKYNAN